MAAAKAKGSEVAAWISEMHGGKFDSPVGAKRSLGYKKHWPKADKTRAEEAITAYFASSTKASAPGTKAPASPAAAKVPTAAKSSPIPLTDAAHASACEVESVVNIGATIVRANSRALLLMDKGLIPFDAQEAQIMSSNIVRACLSMAAVLPAAQVEEVRAAEQAAADTEEGETEEEAEEEEDEAEDGPDKFRAR
jgi:hypothetical protein